MVRHEVEHERDAPPVQFAASDVQPVPSPHARIRLVRVDAVGRSRHIIRRPPRQRTVVLRTEALVCERQFATERAALPHTHQENARESAFGEAVPLDGGHVAKRHKAVVPRRQAFEPRPGSDFEKVRMPHGSVILAHPACGNLLSPHPGEWRGTGTLGVAFPAKEHRWCRAYGSICALVSRC
jgi:hypothetical protein